VLLIIGKARQQSLNECEKYLKLCLPSCNMNLALCDIQGDQIGRIFAQWVTVYFWQIYENCSSRQYFKATLFNFYGHVLILAEKLVGRNFGANFFKTHLVTLAASYNTITLPSLSEKLIFIQNKFLIS
jgi:hypothetical protein